MDILNSNAFADPEICRPLLDKLNRELDQPLCFMEVCGTHTVAIFRSGLRSLLPDTVTHLSGPGCPVCVTHEREVAAFLNLAMEPEIIIATFGDLMRVPGPKGMSLKDASAQGARTEIVYSPLDALALAQKNPQKEIVFMGIGFETTAPTVAATIQRAKAKNIKNFSVLSFHKLVPPALRLLLSEKNERGKDFHKDSDKDLGVELGESPDGTLDKGPDKSLNKEKTDGGAQKDKKNLENSLKSPLKNTFEKTFKKTMEENRPIDAFLLPGHVSTILGIEPFDFIASEFGKTGIVGGFSPADILQSLLLMLDLRRKNKAAIFNQYKRAVDDKGNARAREILFDVFEVCHAHWRGLGKLKDSGLKIRKEYSDYDAYEKFKLSLPEVEKIKGCQCGDILRGILRPDECKLFGKACTPAKPVGPCMVSTEGSCAAYFKYNF